MDTETNGCDDYEVIVRRLLHYLCWDVERPRIVIKAASANNYKSYVYFKGDTLHIRIAQPDDEGDISKQARDLAKLLTEVE